MNDRTAYCLKALLATKLFPKMACVLAKIDQAAFPTLDDMSKALDQQVNGIISLWPAPSLVFSNFA